jgi:hypothetical protein
MILAFDRSESADECGTFENKSERWLIKLDFASNERSGYDEQILLMITVVEVSAPNL